jgi:PAP2 superfamily
VTRDRLIRGGRELVILAVLYGAYSLVRNLMGDNEAVAFENAHRIVSAEKALFIFHEPAIQDALDHGWIMAQLNSFYGIAHFTVTAGIMLWLYHRRASYSRYRNAILVTTLVALVGYLTFPLAPPRMLPEYGFFDAMARYGSPWTYENSAVGSISNQFAAMPSLHIGWALWCSWVIWKEGAFRWLRPVAVLYTSFVLLTIVATGNHYFLDAVGGLVVLLIGVSVTHPFHKRAQERLEAAARAEATEREAAALEAVVPAVDGDDVSGVVAARPRGEVHGEAAEVLG